MIPFLERLAARSLEALPVLQPRRASRFEATVLGGVDEGSAEETLGSSPKPQDPTARIQSPDQPPAIPKAIEAAGPPPPRPRFRPEAPVPPIPAPLRGSSPRIEDVLRPTAPLLGPTGPPLSLPKALPAALPAESRTAALPGERPSREARPLLMEPARALPLLETFPISKREAAAAAAMAPPAPGEDVHISIGRIEIRALPAKAAAAPRRPQDSRPSSLDTYLQQRGGRRVP
ncbi:MAG TPA: hypothetical protein VJ549_03825 [Geothrix sp.]|nr:hypothetical protein [Geothrix sp.]